jgi:hypothetical protein
MVRSESADLIWGDSRAHALRIEHGAKLLKSRIQRQISGEILTAVSHLRRTCAPKPPVLHIYHAVLRKSR